MINTIQGTIIQTESLRAIIQVDSFSFDISVPHADTLRIGEKSTIYTHLHWSAETGPKLYGFENPLERDVFLLITTCPKIGPKIALSILSQMKHTEFIKAINTQNISAFTNISGIGTKKAEQLIMHLKDHASGLISSEKYAVAMKEGGSMDWNKMNSALNSLGYSKQEIQQALKYATNLSQQENLSLDQLLRKTLSHLSKPH